MYILLIKIDNQFIFNLLGTNTSLSKWVSKIDFQRVSLRVKKLARSNLLVKSNNERKISLRDLKLSGVSQTPPSIRHNKCVNRFAFLSTYKKHPETKF